MHDSFSLLTLAEQPQAFVLVSFIKPILGLAVFIFYMRLISTKLEPDIRFFHFNIAGWNGAFLGAAVASIGAIVFINLAKSSDQVTSNSFIVKPPSP